MKYTIMIALYHRRIFINYLVCPQILILYIDTRLFEMYVTNL